MNLACIYRQAAIIYLGNRAESHVKPRLTYENIAGTGFYSGTSWYSQTPCDAHLQENNIQRHLLKVDIFFLRNYVQRFVKVINEHNSEHTTVVRDF